MASSSTSTSPIASPPTTSSSSGAAATATLRETYGYAFDSEGRLKDVKTGEPFEFDVFGGDRRRNQNRYEEIGELVTLIVYDLLESSCGLRRLTIPVDAKEDEPSGFVFVSQDFLSNPNLLVLINGSGPVRAGQWARRSIINDCLDSGTQMPFIREAQSRGFAVLVLNTNQNQGIAAKKVSEGVDVVRGEEGCGGIRGGNGNGDVDVAAEEEEEEEEEKLGPIRGSSDPREHGCYVFEKILMEIQNLEQIIVVAFSYGGVVTLDIATEFQTFWQTKVKAVAFADSVHGDQKFLFNQWLASWFANNAVNWVTSDKDMDEPLEISSIVACVSAGHTNHASTSWSAFKSIFNFFEKKLDVVKKENMSK